MKTDSPVPELSRERGLKGLGSALRWISALMLISGLLLCAGALPLESSLKRLSSFIDGAGPWGPILYGVTYSIATVATIASRMPRATQARWWRGLEKSSTALTR